MKNVKTNKRIINKLINQNKSFLIKIDCPCMSEKNYLQKLGPLPNIKQSIDYNLCEKIQTLVYEF